MKLSWSWPAFFATFAWLRAHKLHRLSWLYFFVSTPILLAAWIGWSAMGPDACLQALDPGPDLVGIAILGLIATGWLVPPLLAGRLARDASVAGRGGYLGSLFFQLLLLVIAAVGAPAYGNYATRSKVSSGIAAAASLKFPVAEYLADKGRLPTRVDEISVATRGRYISDLSITRDGTIKAVYGGEQAGALTGRTISMVPRIEGQKVVEWTCRSDDLPDACLPASCRKEK